jgi:hypothetical protein
MRLSLLLAKLPTYTFTPFAQTNTLVPLKLDETLQDVWSLNV